MEVNFFFVPRDIHNLVFYCGWSKVQKWCVAKDRFMIISLELPIYLWARLAWLK